MNSHDGAFVVHVDADGRMVVIVDHFPLGRVGEVAIVGSQKDWTFVVGAHGDAVEPPECHFGGVVKTSTSISRDGVDSGNEMGNRDSVMSRPSFMRVFGSGTSHGLLDDMAKVSTWS